MVFYVTIHSTFTNSNLVHIVEFAQLCLLWQKGVNGGVIK